jgi:hypothetical protein
MNIRNLIRNIIEESLLIEEDKAAMLRKTNLDPKRQQYVLDLFKKKPHLEKEIDWNNYKRLNWLDDFAPLFEQGDMGKEFKSLKKNEDYLELKDSSLKNVRGLVGVYFPLNYHAAHVLTKKAGGNRAKWCIGYDGDDSYWERYTFGTGEESYFADEPSVFMIFIFNNDKYAVQVRDSSSFIVWDAEDNNRGDKNDIVPGVDVKKIISKYNNVIDSVFDFIGNRDRKQHEEFLDYIGVSNKSTTIKRHSDDSVSIFGSVNLMNRNLDELPIKYRFVEGYFMCSHNNLTSLDGAPEEVGDEFNCSYNNLTNLVGAPKTVGDSFFCNGNQLTNLVGAPKTVGTFFSCTHNNLTSLDGAPEEVGSWFKCSDNTVQFTEQDVRNVSDVGGNVIVD